MSMNPEQEARLLLNLQAAGLSKAEAGSASWWTIPLPKTPQSIALLALSERCTVLEQQLADTQKGSAEILRWAKKYQSDFHSGYDALASHAWDELGKAITADAAMAGDSDAD